MVGHHVHVDVCWPAYGTSLSGKVPLAIRVELHEVPINAEAAMLRVRTLNGTDVYRRTTDLDIPLDAHRNGVRTFDAVLDLDRLSAGSHEFRITYEIRYRLNGTDREQFQSTGAQGCVETCTGPDRSIPWLEARGYYKLGAEVHGYHNGRLRSPTSCLRPGGTCRVELVGGSDSEDHPTVETLVTIDPNMHAGIIGRVIRRDDEEFRGDIVIPADLSSGFHRLVLVSSDGKNAGVATYGFLVP